MSDNLITFGNVSRFYGEVLGINKVSLAIPPGITSLVGPNGSGKTTLMNLMTGLIRPTQGEISVLGISPEDPERLCRAVGYCAQFDTYPKGLTGYQFVYSFLRMFGYPHEECDQRTMTSLQLVGLTDARNRPVAAYSKGMRQRVKLAQSTAHDPQVVILDEPLNGLDPLARAEAIALFVRVGQRRAAMSSSRATSCTKSIALATRSSCSARAMWSPKARSRMFAAKSRISPCRFWCAAITLASWPPNSSSRITSSKPNSTPTAAVCCCAPPTPMASTFF